MPARNGTNKGCVQKPKRKFAKIRIPLYLEKKSQEQVNFNIIMRILHTTRLVFPLFVEDGNQLRDYSRLYNGAEQYWNTHLYSRIMAVSTFLHQWNYFPLLVMVTQATVLAAATATAETSTGCFLAFL